MIDPARRAAASDIEKLRVELALAFSEDRDPRPVQATSVMVGGVVVYDRSSLMISLPPVERVYL